VSANKNSILHGILKSATLFRDLNNGPWMIAPIDKRSVSVPLNPRRMETRLLVSRWVPNRSSASDLDDIIQALAQRALTAPIKEPFIRLGRMADEVYLDLARDDSLCVRVRAGEWELIQASPVPFYRPKGMLALPVPSRDHEDLAAELGRVVRSSRRPDTVLIAAMLIGMTNPRIPQMVLELHGAQGSGKSTLTKFLRACIDPNTAPVRRVPRDERDLFVWAGNTWVLGIDNASSLPPWFSDAACSIATGGGFATRLLYTDDQEAIFNVRRPIILNSIHPVILRPDLQDRALSIGLPEIESGSRQTEAELSAGFSDAQPRILGAMLDCTAAALLMENCINPPTLPRVADWFKFVLAAAEGPSAGFDPDEFASFYQLNREAVHQIAIDSSPIGRVVFQFAQQRRNWMGTFSKLLGILNGWVKARDRAFDWPRTPEALRHALDRISPDLAREGVTRDRERQVTLAVTGEST
jgi:putative DNA primase/helicase